MKTELQKYPLFVALTRPPKVWGVTQTFFIFNFVPCFCLLLLTKQFIFTIGIFSIIHLFGVIGTAIDDSYFDIFLGKLSFTCANRNLWGCNSYDPE